MSAFLVRSHTPLTIPFVYPSARRHVLFWVPISGFVPISGPRARPDSKSDCAANPTGERTMKTLFVKRLAAAALVAGLLAELVPIASAQAPGPVLQQVVISGHRQRFDNPKAAAVVRYI